MRQRRCLELVKDYDCDISYHPSKANVVADAMSKKHAVIAYLSVQRPLQAEIQIFELAVYARGNAPNLVTLTVQSTLRDRIRAWQTSDEQFLKWRQRDEAKGQRLYTVVDDIVRYMDHLWDPDSDFLRADILSEAHNTTYSIHPGSTKMYKDLQILYWWPGMKRDILHFVFRVFELSAGQGRTSKTCGEAETTPYSKVEMVENHYKLCNRASEDFWGIQCHLDDC
ncbi:uncharacterized protein [Primulina huaijiensis]|uniref:uncharacterized protein n=1 Tax=Primulina huaijiensis TaxID=1492673 RepID=UPI003CC76C57